MKKILILMLLLTLGITLSMSTTYAKKAIQPKLSKKKTTIYVGNSTTLKIKNAKKSKVKWSSSKKSVATVSKKGVVTGKKAGKTTITAKIGGKKYKAKITVKTSGLNTESITLTAGNFYQLNVLEVQGKIDWSSSNDSIVKVNSNGMISGLCQGSAIITAKVQSVTYSCAVSVVNALSNADFNFIIPDDEGYMNYINFVIAKGQSCYVYYDKTTYQDGYRMENRGVSAGDTYNSVIAAFGYNNDFTPVSNSDKYREHFSNALYPRNFIEYKYRENYVNYIKRFYFDGNNNLVLIIWYCKD